MLKRILKILLIVLIILILVIAGYVVYVFASYHRAEDNITLEVEGKAQESALPVCRTLTAVTYNLGFLVFHGRRRRKSLQNGGISGKQYQKCG